MKALAFNCTAPVNLCLICYCSSKAADHCLYFSMNPCQRSTLLIYEWATDFRSWPLVHQNDPVHFMCPTVPRSHTLFSLSLFVFSLYCLVCSLKIQAELLLPALTCSKRLLWDSDSLFFNLNFPCPSKILSDILNFCANNYLGLSSHPEVVQAGIDALKTHGAGLSSVRFICGTQVSCLKFTYITLKLSNSWG